MQEKDPTDLGPRLLIYEFSRRQADRESNVSHGAREAKDEELCFVVLATVDVGPFSLASFPAPAWMPTIKLHLPSIVISLSTTCPSATLRWCQFSPREDHTEAMRSRTGW
jgi:hypothetical protein